MVEIAIVGGGVHGTFLSHALTREAGLGRSDVVVIDAYNEPLYKWNRNTYACGMRYLRSPSSHSLDIDFHAMRDFARRPENSHLADFLEPYARPALPLFQAHVAHLFERYRLAEMRRQAVVTQIDLHDDRAVLHLAPGSDAGSTAAGADGGDTLEARRVVLAPGHNEHPYRPRWAHGWGTGTPVRHVFEDTFEPQFAEGGDEPVVVGGGLSGCQLALATANQTGRPVTVVARHPLKVTHFDSNPCYIGPKCLRDFLRIPDTATRRETIKKERNPGTVPWDVFEEMQGAIRDGRIRFVVDEIGGLRRIGDSRLELALSQGGQSISTDRLLLATGFHRTPLAENLVRDLARRYDLPRGPNGYPVPDSALRWHPRLFVIGALGELELGPSCLNIIGAHHAARRIVSLFRSGEPSEAPWTPLVRLKG